MGVDVPGKVAGRGLLELIRAHPDSVKVAMVKTWL